MLRALKIETFLLILYTAKIYCRFNTRIIPFPQANGKFKHTSQSDDFSYSSCLILTIKIFLKDQKL